MPVAAGLFARDRFRRNPGASKNITVEFCPAFDGRFDAFWEAFRSANPDRLLAVRSRELLEWHFSRPKSAARLWIAAASRGGSLLAYAIFDRKDNPDLSLRRMRLVDFVAVDGSAELLGSIVRSALHRCAEEQLDILETTGSWLNLAPYQRRLANWTCFYRAGTSALSQRLARAQAWMPSLYDGNASL